MFRAAFEQGERIGAGPAVRLWRRLLLFGSRWWQLESLYRANAKYQPDWTPRYLCFGGARDLPRIGIASALAEGFLTAPSLRRLQRDGVGRRRRQARRSRVPEAARTPTRSPRRRRGARPPAGAGPGAPREVRADARRGHRALPGGPPPHRGPRAGRERFGHLGPDTATGEQVSVTGRVVRVRDFGGLCFAVLQDGDARLQVMLTADRLGRDGLRQWAGRVDLGDHVGVTGEVVTTRRGELSVLADSWPITAKCLRPLPDKHRGLSDPEARVRQRYVDLIVNTEARTMLRQRSDAVARVRESSAARLPRGRDADAAAGARRRQRPAVRDPHQRLRHAALPAHRPRAVPQAAGGRRRREGVRDQPQLPQRGRRLHAQPRVHHARGVRGLRRLRHDAGADAGDDPEGGAGRAGRRRRRRTSGRSSSTCGGAVAVVTVYDGDLARRWARRSPPTPRSSCCGALRRRSTCRTTRRGAAASWCWSCTSSWWRTTVEPTFYRDFPIDVSPLTRQHRDDPRLAERWDLVGFGAELGTAYSELVDPIEQRRRLIEQSLLAAGGDPEAMELDEDFLARSSTRCRRRVGWAWASTAW